MSRTHEEIVARIEARTKEDFFGFETGDLIVRLPFALAKPYLKDSATEADWDRAEKDPLDEMREYLSFAWDKANSARGISASRSVSHCRSWLWLAGLGDLADSLEDHYEYYGKPCLVIASEVVKFPWRDHDDGVWSNSEDSDGGISTGRRDAIIAEMVAIAQSASSKARAA